MDLVFVEDDGTGRRTFEVEGFSRNVLGLFPFWSLWFME
jgi:hypothetical protein